MTAAELIQNYTEARRRLMGPSPVAPRIQLVPVITEAKRDYLFVQFDPVFESPNESRRKWKDIVMEVAKQHELSVAMLMKHTRQRDIVAARFEAYYRIRNETSLSLPEIGRRMGGFDHTGVLHGIRKHEERLKKQRDGAREALAISSLTDTLNQ